MPDLQQFSITPTGATNVNVPGADIACQIVDSTTQSVILADFTGANTLHFPSVLATLTGAQRAELISLLAEKIVFMKAGLG